MLLWELNAPVVLNGCGNLRPPLWLWELDAVVLNNAYKRLTKPKPYMCSGLQPHHLAVGPY